jgi:hypothetical protein
VRLIRELDALLIEHGPAKVARALAALLSAAANRERYHDWEGLRTSPETESEPTGTSRYGQHSWGVKSPLSDNWEVHVLADRVQVNTDGSVVFITRFRKTVDDEDGPEMCNLLLAPGQWTAVYVGLPQGKWSRG